jgi:hypothetical protein
MWARKKTGISRLLLVSMRLARGRRDHCRTYSSQAGLYGSLLGIEGPDSGDELALRGEFWSEQLLPPT